MSAANDASALAAGLPRLLLAAERLAHVAAPGAHGRRRAGPGESFWQFREFRDGDESRRIDWRRSGSGDRFLVREREWEAQASVGVRLHDTAGLRFRSGRAVPSKRERAVLLLLAVSFLLLEAGERVALAGVTPPMTGRAALQKIAEALVNGGAARTDPKAREIAFGDFLLPDPVFAAPPGGAVVQILDPAECDFPYGGRVIFSGYDGEAPVEAARAEGLAAAYRARLEAQKAAVAAAALRSGQTKLFHRTDAPPATVLAAFVPSAFGGAFRTMMFLAPVVLVGLLALPAMYFLLRVTPPAARRIAFPPLALLRDLSNEERTPQNMPLWLLLLRLTAAGLVIIGLAGPALHPAPALPGRGPVLLVIDNGWASAADWTARRDAALRIIGRAAQSGRGVAILATARAPSGQAPLIQGVMEAGAARQIVAALQPAPWPADRAGAAAVLRAAPAGMTKVYLADGTTDGAGFRDFMAALKSDRTLTDGIAAELLAPAGLTANGGIAVRRAAGSGAAVLAEAADGSVLSRATFSPRGVATIELPLALSSRVAKIVMAAPLSAGGVLLLDGSAHGTLIGLASGGLNAEAPYVGALFFVRRALPAGSQVVTGSLRQLISEKVSVIMLADAPLTAEDVSAAQEFLAQGGEVIRFAGPLTAEQPDGLSPDPLLAGDRRMGGALTWTAPQTLAAFPQNSPFVGLTIDPGAKISRQVLADPTQLDTETVWASLADGTPLVLGRQIGRGTLVAVLTTANADWSGLALSGLFPTMLQRLTALSHGAPAKPGETLRLTQALDAFGDLAPAGATASFAAADLPAAQVSPAVPPGIYGAGAAAVALNLGGHVPPVVAADLPGAVPMTGEAPQQDFGPDLLLAALALLAVDLLLSLRLRGFLRLASVLLVFGSIHAARAQDAALATTLAYVITGNAAADQVSADGLSYLSAIVSSHSSARLGGPAGVTPGVDDLNLYPLLYWPVLANEAPPSAAACAALIGYMQYGGLLVIDTEGGDADAPGSGAGFSPGAQAALNRATGCLNLPPLERLTTANVVAHCFYIVPDFPGRFTGAPVFIATPAARDADGVTPVMIGQNDWVGAWAHDANGNAEQTPIPNGEDQRTIAERFGTNLVIYALTGSYKADQANLPAMLDKIGQ